MGRRETLIPFFAEGKPEFCDWKSFPACSYLHRDWRVKGGRFKEGPDATFLLGAFDNG